MEWTQVFAIMGGNLAIILPLWLWSRSENRSDMRGMETILEAIRQDMKDFHGRLCAIEERNRSK